MPPSRTLAALLLLLLLPTTALAAPPDVDDQDDARRRAEAFQRLVVESLPVPRPPATPVQPAGTINAGRGPIPVYVPASYDPASPTPLVILLHGYMNDGQEVEDWMQFASLVDELGFLYLHPTGTSDFLGNPFWNATDACCNLFGSSVNDAAYLRSIITIMETQYNVDPRRIHFAGHSNGGFMSYRMACDYADVVASIASLAGATWLDPSDCAPSEPVATLQIHGTSDGVIAYTGGCIPFGGCYPGAVATTQTWAGYDGCAIVGTPGPEMLDLSADIAGAEASVTRYVTDCAPGGSAELWTIPGGPHSPNLSADFSRLVLEFLLAHPKPLLCPTDLDGDEETGFGDLLALLATWGPCASCPEDLDGDGLVGFDDLLSLLAAWGPCTE